jgi:hypothetical protein
MSYGTMSCSVMICQSVTNVYGHCLDIVIHTIHYYMDMHPALGSEAKYDFYSGNN